MGCDGVSEMERGARDVAVELFSTCPASSLTVRDRYGADVVQVARWSDEAGCTGILVYSDNSQVDPWLVAQLIIQHTTHLCPLVAVQPVYMHPYAVAKQVASLAYLHGRRVYLNMVAGGFKNDLLALCDPTPHDKRYDRLTEYTTIIKRLLTGEPVSYAGEFYTVDKLKLTPALPVELFPGIFISGSSEAGLAAARAIGATAVKYPQPAEDEAAPPPGIPFGVRVGIIAREHEREAWEIAQARFPEDRRGQLTRQLATKVSDSVWHHQLSGTTEERPSSPYWMVPFQNYQTNCPYLVGSYDRVAAEVGRYVGLGHRVFILDVPRSADDLLHTRAVFERAVQAVAR